MSLKDELINEFRKRDPEVLQLENWTAEELAGYWFLQENHTIEDFDKIPEDANIWDGSEAFRDSVRSLVVTALREEQI